MLFKDYSLPVVEALILRGYNNSELDGNPLVIVVEALILRGYNNNICYIPTTKVVVEALILRGYNNYFQHSLIYDDYVSPLLALGCGGLCWYFCVGDFDWCDGCFFGVFLCASHCQIRKRLS